MRGRLLGPDLLNVTQRRERGWLARWLAEPEKLLAEEDPIAVELYAKHDRVTMPNLSLNGKDVTALIDFMETESRRVEKAQQLRGVVATSQEGAGVSEKASCCQKDKTPVLTAKEKSEKPDPSARVEPVVVAAGKPEGRQERVSRASLLLPGGLGCVLLLLAFVFGRGKPVTPE
jgi:hypothetical protein